MIAAFDSYYFNDKVKTVCVLFPEWEDEEKATVYSKILDQAAPYESGQFYRRELPAILDLLHDLGREKVDLFIVDGFVWLDDNGQPGLGFHLHEQSGKKIPVIGVAKSDFAPLHLNKRTVFRGKTRRPLFITAVGIDLDESAAHIKKMDGKFRMPTILKQLDAITRNQKFYWGEKLNRG